MNNEADAVITLADLPKELRDLSTQENREWWASIDHRATEARTDWQAIATKAVGLLREEEQADEGLRELAFGERECRRCKNTSFMVDFPHATHCLYARRKALLAREDVKGIGE